MPYDYVVVGAGSAGCVVASRLSEDPAVSVALIEAGGPDKRQEIHIPAAFSKLFRSECDWAYETEPQRRLNNRRLFWPRGRMLGGSSSMNAMIWTRGHRCDFDSWQQDGWRFDDVVPAFEKAQVNVCGLRTVNPLSAAFVRACEENGIPRNDAMDVDVDGGAGLFHVSQRNGKRNSCAVAYLKPARSRPNLTVMTNTQTTRVVFDGTRAAGVECVSGGKPLRIDAKREVILCGGAINSPQLLMLSGVGPPDHLRAHGIGVVADIPDVGENLQDHLVSGVAHASTQPVTLARAESIGNIVRYLVAKKGMLSSNVAEAGGFVRIDADAPAPDVELIFAPSYYMNHGFGNPKGHGFTVGAILLHPKSRGTIRLRSNNPLSPPAIDPDYFAHDDDLRVLAEGVKLCRSIARAKAFDACRGEEVLPGAQDVEPFLRETSETLYHPVGTCAIGSVVDAKLRVRGVDALRVIDASVMPNIVTGHPNAAVVMIAEKGAELLRA